MEELMITNKDVVTILILPHRMTIFKILRQLYEKNCLPTYTDIYNELKQYLQSQGFRVKIQQDKFLSDFKLLGFIFHKIANNIVIMENPELTFERVLYLKKIKKARETKGTEVYYLDVRLIDNNLKLSKPNSLDQDLNIDNPDYRLVFYHLISSTGYVHGLFCNIMKFENYFKWMTDSVLKIIKPNSVIIMNNKVLTGMDTHTVSRLDTKKSMLKYLKDCNIPCSKAMHKAELYELIMQCPKSSMKSKVERIFKAEGHEILQLPTSIHILTATEMMWSEITKKQRNFSNLEVKSFILEGLQAIYKCTWMSWDKAIKFLENEIYELDLSIEMAFEKCLEMIDH